MPPDPTRTLDLAMPEFDVREVHSIRIQASQARAWDALLTCTPREIRLLGPLMAVRMLPGMLRRRKRPPESRDPWPAAFERMGFEVLHIDEPREIVLGAVGRFWSLTGNAPIGGTPTVEALAAFDRPGYAKAAFDFRIELGDGGCRLTTETRVAGTDSASSRKFRLYWLAIRPGSGAIRHSWLRAVARRATN